MRKHWGNLEIIFLALVLFFSAFVRFYNLDKLAFFTYDQARDALYIKRIIVDHTWRLISTQSSIPGLYNGPAYYYLMAPFLWIFKLNPIGIDYGIAFFNLLAVLVFYFLVKDLTGNFLLSLLATMVFSFQPQIIFQSRFGWNPNLLPFFSLLFVFSFWLLKEGKKWAWLILSFSLAVMLQLHYSSAAFLLILFCWLFYFRKKIIFEGFFRLSLILFLFIMSPLLLFDLRHNFVNVKAVFLYFFQGAPGKIAPPPFLTGLWQKTEYLLPKMVFGVNNQAGNLFLILILFFIVIFVYRNSQKLKEGLFLISCWLGGGILFSSFYQGSFFNFYLTFLYPAGFLLLALLSDFFWQKAKILKIFLISLFVFLAFGNYRQLTIFQSPSRTIGDLKKEAQIIAKDAPLDKPFNLAAVLKGERFDHNAVDYRYFLETYYQKKALDWEPIDYQKAQILYLISEEELKDPLTIRVMEVEEFQPKVVLEQITLPSGRIVYKIGK